MAYENVGGPISDGPGEATGPLLTAAADGLLEVIGRKTSIMEVEQLSSSANRKARTGRRGASRCGGHGNEVRQRSEEAKDATGP